MQQAYDETIKVGDRVRSFDFEGRDDHYVDGVVEAMDQVFDGCKRYTIKVERAQYGEESVEYKYDRATDTANMPDYVYPPINGTPKLFGGVTAGVVKR